MVLMQDIIMEHVVLPFSFSSRLADVVMVVMQDNSMERVVLPFSGLASWVLILGGVLATLHVLGINIQPLLTVGGVSGVVVGLSAQSVMSNMISGINLVSILWLTLCPASKKKNLT